MNKLKHITLFEIYFIVCLYLFPNMFLGFVDRNIFFNWRLLDFLLPISLLFFSFNFKKVRSYPGKKTIILLAYYSLIMIGYSFFYCRINLKEIFSSFRWNCSALIPSYCILHTVERMDKNKLENCFNIIIFFFILQCLLGDISAIFHVDFFANCRTDDAWIQSLENGTIYGNTMAFSKHYLLLVCYVFSSTLFQDKNKLYVYLIFVLILPILMTRRMYSLVAFFELIICRILQKYIAPEEGHQFKYFIIISFVVLFSVLFFNQGIKNAIIHKITPNRSSGESVSLDDYSTYKFRQLLVEDAINSHSSIVDKIFGNGYHRDDEMKFRGHTKYSYVLGEDSPVAAILFCESFIGVLLRLLPYFFIIIESAKILLKKIDYLYIPAVTAISYVLSQIPAYIQTQMISRLDQNFCYLIIIYFVYLNRKVFSDEQKENFEYHFKF